MLHILVLLFYTNLLFLFVLQKVTSSTAEKSFAVGTLAEVIEACGEPVGSAFTTILYPVFTRMAKDEDDEVRSNSVFALGVLAVNGGNVMIGLVYELFKPLENCWIFRKVCFLHNNYIDHMKSSILNRQIIRI